MKRLRRAHGWTQAQLAERLAVDAMTISRWERGLSKPRRAAREAMMAVAISVPEQRGRPAAQQPSHGSNRFASEHAAIGELVRIVGVDPALRALRRLVLLKSAPRPARLPIEPVTRLREVESALREQLDLNARARIG